MQYLAAAVQYDAVYLDKEQNLANLTALTRDAVKAGAKLVVWPEMCTI